MTLPRWCVAAAVAATALLTACTASPAPDSAESAYPEPPDTRPVVELGYTFAEELTGATGAQTVSFTPDAPVCEVVFRAWPNKPATARTGNAMRVTSVSVDGTALEVRQEAAGAPPEQPGTLVEASLPACVEAGTEITAEVTFDVTIASRTDERMGRSDAASVAWLGSAFPMLAWVNGEGWQRNPAADAVGEMAASDVFDLSLAVTAPSRFQAAAVGVKTGETENSGTGTTTRTFAAPVTRDVPVYVGYLDITTEEEGGVPMLVATAAGSEADGTDHSGWIRETRDVIADLERYFGPYPFERAQVHVLPFVSSGIEFGETFQMNERRRPADQRWLIAHELAHAWFYGLVGSNQGEDPWLDESFATYAQELVAPTGHAQREPIDTYGALGQPMQWWQHQPQRRSYSDIVYSGGAQALLTARERVGEEEFDSLVRDHLRRHAYGFITPADLKESLAPAPEAVRLLREAGGL